MTSIKTLANSKVQYPLPLIYKEDINHDTRLYRFGLPTEDHVLGLPIGQHIHFTAEINGRTVVRKYSPITSDKQKGYVDLVIKVYFSGNPEFPDGGKMTQYVDSLKLGDTIDVRGPAGRLIYTQPGAFAIRKNKKDPSTEEIYYVKKVNMIAGGSGIAPMLQIVRQITQDPTDDTEIRLLFANKSEDDILLRKELDECREKYPHQFKVWYTVDKPKTESWQYGVGYVTANMMREHLFPPSPETIVLVCGPDPMINFACTPNLDTVGYDPKLRFIYKN